jgi:hypothetical protein
LGIKLPAVQRDGCAVLAGEFQLPLLDVEDQDDGAESTGDLDGMQTQAPDTDDGDTLAGLETSDGQQGVIGREDRVGGDGRGSIGNGVRDGNQCLSRDSDVLGLPAVAGDSDPATLGAEVVASAAAPAAVAAADRTEDDVAATDFDAGHSLAAFHGFTADLVTQRQGCRNRVTTEFIEDDVQVGVAEASCADAQEHLAALRNGAVDLDETEIMGIEIAGCSHGAPSLSRADVTVSMDSLARASYPCLHSTSTLSR